MNPAREGSAGRLQGHAAADRPASFAMPVAAELTNRTFEVMQSTVPVWELMREDERKAGYVVIKPGGADWLPAADWHPTVVVSLDVMRAEIRLVAIAALRPGQGALRRLIAAARRQGYKPVIVMPNARLRATLIRWGWRPDKRHGVTGLEEQWRPPKPFAEPFP